MRQRGGDTVGEIFTPHELKTIEVDVKKKIFRVNGEDFGKGCTSFHIGCDANNGDFFEIGMRVDTTIKFANYDFYGKKTYEGERRRPQVSASDGTFEGAAEAAGNNPFDI